MIFLGARRREETAGEALVRALFSEHAAAIAAHAFHLTGDRGMAEDIVQETVLRAWRNADRLLARQGSIRWWLLTVARNLAIDRIRLRGKHPETPDPETTSDVHHDHADHIVDAMTLSGALDHLPAVQREVVEQLYFLDRSVEETARTLGIPPGTVKSRSYYGKQALRGLLADRRAAQ
ncbi:sigma-70 family RNA polymerase sigma factor [Amycolatopsis pigmentata]|uniref:Sigma-70 family RNA polymerase sigma factor n=1 Tax=Amycolatopsis pigmentata TaxID=450801 RepID=A0ABW5G025_9PSEU